MRGREVALELAAREGVNRKERRIRGRGDRGRRRQRVKPWEPEGPLTNSPSSAAGMDTLYRHARTDTEMATQQSSKPSVLHQATENHWNQTNSCRLSVFSACAPPGGLWVAEHISMLFHNIHRLLKRAWTRLTCWSCTENKWRCFRSHLLTSQTAGRW